MNLKALITTLVLGTSSVASVAVAHPVTPAPSSIESPIVRDHRYTHTTPAPIYQPAQPAPIYQPAQPVTYYRPERPFYRPEPRPYYQGPSHRTSWITLGGVNQIVDGEMAFRVGQLRGEQFSALKLQSDAGKSLIYRVLIQFTNGRTQVVELNQYLNASNPTIKIDLDGRARSIAKVTVIGRNARQSAYRVLAI